MVDIMHSISRRLKLTIDVDGKVVDIRVATKPLPWEHPDRARIALALHLDRLRLKPDP